MYKSLSICLLPALYFLAHESVSFFLFLCQTFYFRPKYFCLDYRFILGRLAFFPNTKTYYLTTLPSWWELCILVQSTDSETSLSGWIPALSLTSCVTWTTHLHLNISTENGNDITSLTSLVWGLNELIQGKTFQAVISSFWWFRPKISEPRSALFLSIEGFAFKYNQNLTTSGPSLYHASISGIASSLIHCFCPHLPTMCCLHHIRNLNMN